MCEIDDVVIPHFEQRTGAKCYGSIQDLDKQLDDGLQLNVDIVSMTVSCASRSRYNRINKKPVCHRDGNLFTKGIATIAKICPRMCYLEMVTADKHYNDPRDFMKAKELLGKHFKHV